MARKQYPLRIDPAIWEAVQRWADDEMRSANGQAEWILRDALKRAGRLPKKEPLVQGRIQRRGGLSWKTGLDRGAGQSPAPRSRQS